MASVKIAISRALEDLSKDDLDKFCHWLLNRQGPPQVRRRQVENKNYLEISDLLVSTFTEAGALKVCVEILREIGCNNEAESLACVSVKMLPSGACAAADRQHFVDKHRLHLTRRVTNIPPILDELLDRRVIHQECYNEIMAVPTSEARMRKIYSTALCSGGDEAKNIFLEILEKNEEYLIADLRK